MSDSSPQLPPASVPFGDRDRLLLSIEETIRDLDDPAAIVFQAARLLGDFLRVNRCVYGSVADDQNTFTLYRDYTRGVPSVEGTGVLSDFGSPVVELLRGNLPFVVSDIELHHPPLDVLEAYRASMIRAAICVPLVKSERLVAVMAVHQATPRQWTPDEVELLRWVAARCWESIQRIDTLRKLRESEQRYSTLFNSIDQGFCILEVSYDDSGIAINYRFLEHNHTFETLTGFVSPAGKTIRELVPNIESSWFEIYGEIARTGVSRRFVNGAPSMGRLYDVYAVRIGGPESRRLAVLFTDIWPQQEAQRKLRESELRLTDTLRSALDCVVGMDHEGRIVEWNPAAERTFGWSREEAIGRMMSDTIIPPALRERHRLGLQRYLDTGVGMILNKRLELIAIRRDGSEVPVELTINPITASDPPSFTGFIRDITQRKADDAEREKLLLSEQNARSEAERVSKLKDEFLATLSHELRTPLNAILGWSQLLRAGKLGTVDFAQGVEVIERNARAQNQIIEDLLDMSRIIGGKVRLDVQRIDLTGIVQNGVDALRPSAEAKSIRLQIVLDPLTNVVVTGDVGRIEQILWNLLSNAIKFTPKGGRVQVLLERVNSHVELSVIDTGEGISSDFLPFVFDRFRQADASITRRHGGLGLGLSIVKQLVELHGGTIRVKSAGRDQGSTFIVHMPITIVHGDSTHGPREHPGISTQNDATEACSTIKNLRVIVIDDEPDARDLMKRLLEECEAVVTTTSSTDEVIELVRSGNFDVLLSDIGMPGEDGYSLIRRVRALGKDNHGRIPAIALTAYARSEDRTRAVAAGFNMHVAKPVEPSELITMIAGAAGLMGG